MGSFFRRAASLKTSASNHPRDSSPNASVSSATSATKNAFVSDASAGARGAMDKLTRGARATARFSMTAHRESGDAFVSPRLSASDAHVAAGVTCRPAQPFIARDETDATTTKSEDGRGSEPRTKGGGANVSKKKVSGSSVVAHWAAASLPAIATSRDFDAGDDGSRFEASFIRELSDRVLAASVAIDKEHAGIAAVPLGDVCGAFLRDGRFGGEGGEDECAAGENRDARPFSREGDVVARPFDVPFDRFARRRGRAEGTLTIETVAAESAT